MLAADQRLRAGPDARSGRDSGSPRSPDAEPGFQAKEDAGHRCKERLTLARNCGHPTSTTTLRLLAAGTKGRRLADVELRYRLQARHKDRIRKAKDTGAPIGTAASPVAVDGPAFQARRPAVRNDIADRSGRRSTGRWVCTSTGSVPRVCPRRRTNSSTASTGTACPLTGSDSADQPDQVILPTPARPVRQPSPLGAQRDRARCLRGARAGMDGRRRACKDVPFRPHADQSAGTGTRRIPPLARRA